MRIGMGQMRVLGGNVEANLNAAVEMIERAASGGCELIVLPECLDLGWTWTDARERAQTIPGERSAQLCATAKEFGLWVVAGLTERDGERVFNAAILISSNGEIVTRHRKINELTIGHACYDVGDRLTAVPSEFGTLGVSICADNFPNSLALGHALGRMGVQLLLSPCAWAMDVGHDHVAKPYGGMWIESYTTLANLYDMTVVGVSCVGPITGGPWRGRELIGNSLAVGPGGKILARGRYGADAVELITFETEIAPPVAVGTDFAEILRSRGYAGSI